MSGHIFISHASADDDFVKKLRRALEDSGLPVWVDSRNLRGGDKLSPEIETAIAQARQVIVVLSPNTINSPWVRHEIQQALRVEQLRKDDSYRVIPLLLPSVQPSALQLWFDEEPVGVKVELKTDSVNEAMPQILTALGGRFPNDPKPFVKAVSQPLEELVLKLIDPRIEMIDGKRRAMATATVIYEPASSASHPLESKRFTFTAPLGPIETDELSWYLEKYYLWPVGLFKDRAARVEAKLPEWGHDLYRAALASDSAREILAAWQNITDGAARCFSVLIDSVLLEGASEGLQDTANEAASELLSLPWELLHDDRGYLFQGARPTRVRRRLPNRRLYKSTLTRLPLRMLLVSPRPEDERAAYIDHRLSAWPLMDAIDSLGDLVKFTVLGPPTFPALKEILRQVYEKGEPFDVVHFDGHGVFNREHGLGALCFEDPKDANKLEQRASELIEADKFASVMRDYRIPLVFLAAGQTATQEKDPTASVAARLLDEGVSSVVAMSHNVLVVTTHRFVRAFYAELAQGRSVGMAMLAGRRALYGDTRRGTVMGAGELHLQDWFVPVLYQEERDVPLITELRSEEVRELEIRARQLRLGALPEEPKHRFVGRSRELLKLERLLIGDQYTVVRGMGGAGKTTLAVELARWLVRTRRFRRAAYVSLEEYSTARGVLDSLGQQLLPENYSVVQFKDLEDALQPVERALRDSPTIIVLDNFESLLPSADATDSSTISESLDEVLNLAQDLLNADPATRIVFTSRERLPAPFDHSRRDVRLGALDRNDAIALVSEVMKREGLEPKADDPGGTPKEIEELVDAVNCHARALELLARELARQGVRATTENLHRLMVELDRRYPDDRRNSLYASIELSLRRLPPEMREQAKALAAFHGDHLIALDRLLEIVGKDIETVQRFAAALIEVGLAEDMGNGHLTLDPALPSYMLGEMSDLTDPGPDLNTIWQGIVDQARRLLAEGNYLAARRSLCEIPQDQPVFWQPLRSELAFAFNFELDEDQDRQLWESRRDQVEWRRKVWAALTLDSERQSTEELNEAPKDHFETQDALNQTQEQQHKIETQEYKRGSVDLGVAPIGSKSSEKKGEALEQDTKRLILRLFTSDDIDVTWKKLRQQSRSSQFGCDIKSVHRRAGQDRDIRCLFECKSHERDLDFTEILGKIFDAKENQLEIDHWILIAPRARIGNVPDGLIERWNLTQELPFAVQLWTNDTDIGQFFGLDPDVYDRWIDHIAGQPHPRNWTSEQKQQIRESWLRRFDPPLRLPKAWAHYVTDKTEEGLFIENDDRESLTELWQKDLHIPRRALDASRTLLSAPLEETIWKWLSDEETRTLLLLADFGDGKTAFSYMFVRHLLEQYRQNPRQGWIPVRFALRRFGRPNYNAREFLRDRLEDLGSNVSEWRQIVEEKNVLVVLDGMDEMTKSLTGESVSSAVDLLTDCCNHEFERVKKLIITCRTPFFEELVQREYVEDKLGSPRILHIEPFDRRRVYEKLGARATSPAQQLKLHTLRQLHDPLGLARKALFFKMVWENFADPQSDFSSETALYQTYINKCLSGGKKTALLASSNQDITETKIRNNLLSIMETIAMEIHLSHKDYVCLRRVKGMTDEDANYAKILWESIDDRQGTREDALHRVGVRSLLQKKDKEVSEEDRKLWPVDFCHRSMRELFVARRIEWALQQGINTAVEILEQVDFNHEIMRFTAELMKTSEYNYRNILRDIAFKESRIDGDRETYPEEDRKRLARLGRTSVTLLYKWIGELPGRDWSNLMLDGAQLSGVDLTGKNLSNTSLQSANLNNAVFVDADFRGADLSGARLEETGEVLSVTVPGNLDGFFAAYHDGTIRQWNLEDRFDDESKVLYELSEKSRVRDMFFQVSAYPGEGLCIYSRDNVVFLNLGEGTKEAGVFAVQNRFLGLTLDEGGLAAVEKANTLDCTIHVFDFATDGFPMKRSLIVGRCILCERLGNRGIVIPLEDGNLVVYLITQETGGTSRYVQIGEFANTSAIASTGFGDSDQRLFLIACGGEDGTVGLWRFEFSDSQNEPKHEEIFRQTIHQGVVTSLSFAGPEILLTGGRDKRICRVDLQDMVNTPKLTQTYELRLQCKGMRIDGLRGEKERAVLEKAMQVQH